MYDLFLTSIIPLESILTDGRAKNGKKSGIKCGFENLHPESTIVLLNCSKFDETFSKGSVEMIPAICKGNDAFIFPEFTTTNQP